MKPSQYVYFIKPVGQDGPIKVGHSAFPLSRLSSLQTWSPMELEVISEFEADRSVEIAIHERFARWQVRGEWFEPVPELVALAAGIKAGARLEDLVDLSIKTGKLFRKPNTKSELAKKIGNIKRRVEMARMYARKMIGHPVALPPNVSSILSAAGGYRREYRDLTDDETKIIEQFIADSRDSLKLATIRNSLAQQVAA